jgi:hypothetical protein
MEQRCWLVKAGCHSKRTDTRAAMIDGQDSQGAAVKHSSSLVPSYQQRHDAS